MPWRDDPDTLSADRSASTGEPDLNWARAALKAALSESEPAADSPFKPQSRFGDYELLGESLGRGATAIVYRARQLSLNRIVAIKIMLDSDLAKEAEAQRFRFGAQAAAELDHPNIARIHQVGEQDGVPFFTMPLFEGGTLAKALTRLRGSRASAVALMAKVARAVHYAHERGVLHRDLKPANIVLGEDDDPFVVDFGFAKHLDERAVSSKPSIVVGTMGYMAPEQAAGDARSLTFASDIYALATILYELLTGEVPYQGLGLAELLERLTSSERVRSPRTIDPTIDRELEFICLRGLEKDPARRYGSAARLAQDLERWLAGEPIAIPSDGGVARLIRWCRARPALSTLLAGAVCVLGATAGVALSVAREEVSALLADVQSANSYAAEAKAGQVLFQLRELSDPVARCAADPRIEALLEKGDTALHPARADRLLIECGARTLFDSVAVLDEAGGERARFPQRKKKVRREEVVRRDSFAGAKHLAERGYRSVHVGRVVRSEDIQSVRQVSLSAPVFDDDNRWIGVISVTIDLNAFLDSLRLSDTDQRTAVLVGVREREAGDPGDAVEARASKPGATAEQDDDQGVMVLLRSKQEDAESAPSSGGPWLKELTRLKQKAAGRDPFRFSDSPPLQYEATAYPVNAFGNRWLSGFAPVGHTGYAVVVQTRYDTARERVERALGRLLGWSAVSVVLGSSMVALLAFRLNGRARKKRG
jgi:tRNA A-37 threonylcarbamoyl transferase component Bud32